MEGREFRLVRIGVGLLEIIVSIDLRFVWV